MPEVCILKPATRMREWIHGQKMQLYGLCNLYDDGNGDYSEGRKQDGNTAGDSHMVRAAGLRRNGFRQLGRNKNGGQNCSDGWSG